MKAYNNLTETWMYTKTLIKNEYKSIRNFCNETKIGTPQKFNPYNNWNRPPKLKTLNEILKPLGKKAIVIIVEEKPHPNNQNLDYDN